MTIDQLFRSAENGHTPLVVRFDPGTEPGRPRGYSISIAGGNSGIHQRPEEAVMAAISRAFGGIAELREQVETLTEPIVTVEPGASA